MENFNLNNCYIKAFDAKFNRITYDTWDEFYTANSGRSIDRIDLCCREGYTWTKTPADGTFIYKESTGVSVVNISAGNGDITTKYNPMKNEPANDTTVRLSASFNMLPKITGITATPFSPTPPKPDKPNPLKTYPNEVLENVYIDDWAIVIDPTTNPVTRKRVVRDYDTVKDFLDKSSGRTKRAITLQTQAGFNFSLDDTDGSMTFYNGKTYTFKYMYDNGIPVGENPPYNEPDSYRQRTYPDAKKFVFRFNKFSKAKSQNHRVEIRYQCFNPRFATTEPSAHLKYRAPMRPAATRRLSYRDCHLRRNGGRAALSESSAVATDNSLKATVGSGRTEPVDSDLGATV